MAFWTYTQTLSLVLNKTAEKKLSVLYTKHRDVYSKLRPFAQPQQTST